MSSTWPPTLDPAVDGLRGVERVTALLLCMGKEHADRIIKQLDDREIRLVARAASVLPSVPPETLEWLVDRLSAELVDTGALIGSAEEAQQLISGAVSDDKLSEIMSELDGTSADRVWLKLAAVEDEKLAAFLAAEQPQVAAVVLSRLDVDKASAVVSKLPGELRSEVCLRLLALRPVGETTTRIIAGRIERELLLAVDQGNGRDNHARLGSILNRLDRSQIAEILARIEQKDRADARLVREHVFSFEDVVAMTPQHRTRLFDQVQSDRIVTALRGADAAVRDAVLAALSPRSRRIVEAELGNEVNVPAKAVADMRRAIAGLALAMAARSEIALWPSDAPAQPA